MVRGGCTNRGYIHLVHTIMVCTVYPYALNDNVKGVGNVSSMSRNEDLIVYTLFNKHERKVQEEETRQM